MTEELPWYKDGLKFKCTQCGKCCTGAPGYVWVTKEEIVAIAELLKISVDDVARRYIRQRDNRYALTEKKNYDCVFLKDKKCLIYQARPKQCKTYPWWKENLNSKESWECQKQVCEGINDEAPCVPYEIILEKAVENDD